MILNRVTNLDDPRISDFRTLKESLLAANHERFIIEGRGNLLVMLEGSRFAPEAILLSDRTWRAMESELTALDPNCTVYRADQALLNEIVGFNFHRGCLASSWRGEALDPLALARELLAVEKAPRVVVLEGLTNHDNVGGIFRNAMALSGRAVFLCPKTCDPLYRKAIRTSMGGSLTLPFARAGNLVEMLVGLRRLGFEVLALDPAEQGEELSSLPALRDRPVALLVGTEGAGLSDQAIANSDRRVRIQMAAGVDSLNVSVSAAIALYGLSTRSHEDA